MKKYIEARRQYMNLRRFYREASEFVDGDKAPGHEGWKVEIAIDKNNPEDYVTLCYTNSGENVNDQLETFYESCGEGVSGTVITGFDYEIPYEAYLTKGAMSNDIYDRMTKPGLRQNVGIRASNSLMNKQKTFRGVITISNVASAPNVGMKISGGIKHFAGGITEEPIVEEIIEATGSITIGTPTTTTVPLTYDLVLNGATLSDIVLRITDGGVELQSQPASEGVGIAYEFTGLTGATNYVVELYNNNTGTVIATQPVTTENP